MGTVDPTEIKKFAELSQEWWDLNGKLKTLHDINNTRMGYILSHTPLRNKKVLDLGCGGGILTEALAKAGAIATGLDLEINAINVAKSHALENDLVINYEHCAIENLNPTLKFDVITCLEMLEHVPNPLSIIKQLSHHLEPNGLLFLSTINRSCKAYLYTIIGAEYLLNIIPKQTHDYDKYIKPSELASMLRQTHMNLKEMKGLNYNPLSRKSWLEPSVEVNYLCVAEKEK